MPRISLCMIVKNEEAHLAKCLGSVANYVDEIIIVDTGSTDRSKQIAMGYTNKVFDYTWGDDFAKARNYAVSKATNEYILSLDADEIMEDFNKASLQDLIQQNPDKVGRILLINEFTRNREKHRSTVRLGRVFSKRLFQYEGAIHEQLAPLKGGITEYYNVPVRVLHLGYEGDVQVRKKKTERNISLLLAALEKKPQDPYLLYQLGKSYFMEEDYQGACRYFEEVLSIDVDPELEYVQDLVESYGYSLINSEQYEKALQLLNVYEEFSKTADFIFLIALILMNNGHFQEAIEQFLKAVDTDRYCMEGVNSYLAYYNIGVIYECTDNLQQAKDYYKKCKSYGPALARLQEMKP